MHTHWLPTPLNERPPLLALTFFIFDSLELHIHTLAFVHPYNIYMFASSIFKPSKVNSLYMQVLLHMCIPLYGAHFMQMNKCIK